MEWKNPFLDSSGKIDFPWIPNSDKAFILPSPPPEKHGNLIEIPDQFKEDYKDSLGILLAIGPGYWDKKGIFHPAPVDLKPGIKIVYDIAVPWKQKIRAADGTEHELILCGIADILGIAEN